MAEKYEGDERRAPQRWRIKKEISLGDILAFVSAACAVLYAYFTLDLRITRLEDTKSVQSMTDIRQDSEALRYQARIDTQLEGINRKLDRLIERRLQ